MRMPSGLLTLVYIHLYLNKAGVIPYHALGQNMAPAHLETTVPVCPVILISGFPALKLGNVVFRKT